MLKKVLWTLPVLAVGMAIGGLALPSVLAATTAPVQTSPAQSQQWMEQALNTPQGQAMLQACGNFVGQFGQTQK